MSSIISPPSSASSSHFSGGRTLGVEDLKKLTKKERIGQYELDPHFLVYLFNIANTNPSIKKYLEEKDFYKVRSKGKLNIIKEENFFNLLSVNEKKIVSGENYCEIIKNIVLKKELGEDDLFFINYASKRFKTLEDYLNTTNFYDLFKRTPIPTNELTVLFKAHVFVNIITENEAPYRQYLQYINSRHVEGETETGICVELGNDSTEEPQNRQAAEEEGHWKLHIGIDMENNGQAKVDTAYDIVLFLMQKYNLTQLKVVAPYESVNSMKGKEFSIYLRDQRVAEDNINKFILETEELFIKNNILPRSERDEANKPILGSQFFSYRNERTRSIILDPRLHKDRVAQLTRASIEAMSPSYLHGNVIIIHNDDVYFSKNGELVISSDGIHPRTRTREEMEDMDIPLKDNDYIPAVGSERLRKLFNLSDSESYNPFGFQDNKLKLGAINLHTSRVAEEENRRIEAARLEATRLKQFSIANSPPTLQSFTQAQTRISGSSGTSGHAGSPSNDGSLTSSGLEPMKEDSSKPKPPFK